MSTARLVLVAALLLIGQYCNEKAAQHVQHVETTR